MHETELRIWIPGKTLIRIRFVRKVEFVPNPVDLISKSEIPLNCVAIKPLLLKVGSGSGESKSGSGNFKSGSDTLDMNIPAFS